jgi:hypothetical protein
MRTLRRAFLLAVVIGFAVYIVLLVSEDSYGNLYPFE